RIPTWSIRTWWRATSSWGCSTSRARCGNRTTGRRAIRNRATTPRAISTAPARRKTTRCRSRCRPRPAAPPPATPRPAFLPPPPGPPPLRIPPPPVVGEPAVNIAKAINAVDPLHPTAAEDANDATNPRLLLIGSNVVWTYLVTNPSTVSLTINSITDDAGTPTVPGDDFHPTYVSGDANNNHLLDPGETWLFTSAPHTYQVQAGLYGNVATVTATGAGQTVSASDANYHFGTDTILRVQKDINAVDPLHPTVAEDANDPNNPRQLVAGSNAVWTYLLTNPGLVPLTINSFKDDAGTPTIPSDDFIPKYVNGDTNSNGLLDTNETWLYTSA